MSAILHSGCGSLCTRFCVAGFSGPVAVPLCNAAHWQQTSALIQQMPHWRCRSCGIGRARRALSPLRACYNPQNTDNPLVPPSPDFGAAEAVRIQLEALANNDEPWQNHGIKTAYAFGLEIGGLDPSMYFAFPKDLYHEDHFQGMFANRLPELVNNRGFQISSVEEQPATGDTPATTVVIVQVQPNSPQQQPVVFEFHLRRKMVGARKGCLMTHMVKRSGAA